MAKYYIRKTVIAAAITGIICANAQANNYQKYNLTGQKLIEEKAVKKQTQASSAAVTHWLVKLNTVGTGQASKLGMSVAKIKSEIQTAQVQVEQVIATSDLPVAVIAKTSLLVNSLVVEGEYKDIKELLKNEFVAEIYPVRDFTLHVADSADYIRATPLVENELATGEGVRVAVLDTGIDYTHKVFGGAGTTEAYAAAIADPSSVDWPQGQVKGGYDYINYDADPIDVETTHGTHVSHSVTGIAPNVELYVYSVCSNVNCPGISQLLALENAMDPDGNGDISDRVDIINMSLGGDYGDIATDAVGLFINQAVKLGTNVVISAGNDGAYPFIVGGPSTTENALSVGAMTHPAKQTAVGSGVVDGEDVTVQGASFGPVEAFEFTNETIDLIYPDANQTACEAFADDIDFTDKAVILDRGACAFTSKVLAAQAKGAAFVIIANNNDDGTPAPMGGSDSDVTIPSVGVSFATGTALKAGKPFTIKIDAVVLSGAIASFTSRGPAMGGLLKPEITAPGVSIMTAEPGQGDGLTPISGTSFSGPITAGAIGLLKEALPQRNALELKATLMNTANLNVTMEPVALNPDAQLAPISYIGSGLVDVEKAANLPVAAWAKDTNQAALSFGLVSAAETVKLTKTIVVKNFSNEDKVYALSLQQRYQDDVDRAAFSLDYPDKITVPAGQLYSFDVTAMIEPSKLPEWTLDASNVGSQDVSEDLTTLEVDGALIFSQGSDEAFHLVYHVLPKANAAVTIKPVKTESGGAHQLTNSGAATLAPIFTPVTATDDIDADQRFDIIAAAIETFAVPSDTCSEGFVTLTTMVFNEAITHTYVGGFMADFDIDRDGEYDVTVQNGKLEWFYDVEPGTALTFTHGYGATSGALNNLYQVVGNNHLTLQSCISALGLTADDMGATVDVRFRTEEETWTPIASLTGDVVTTAYTFTDVTDVAYADLVDDADNSITTLEPTESAMIRHAGVDFMILSGSGSKPYMATPGTDEKTPPTLAAHSFSVDENTADNTVIGQLKASYAADFANPVSEFIVQSSTSTAVNINANGEVYVANSQILDYDAGLTSVELDVVAVDSKGNISESALITVTVNNLADEESEKPVAKPPVKKKSSGSLAWLTLLAAPLAFIRRRKQH